VGHLLLQRLHRQHGPREARGALSVPVARLDAQQRPPAPACSPLHCAPLTPHTCWTTRRAPEAGHFCYGRLAADRFKVTAHWNTSNKCHIYVMSP